MGGWVCIGEWGGGRECGWVRTRMWVQVGTCTPALFKGSPEGRFRDESWPVAVTDKDARVRKWDADLSTCTVELLTSSKCRGAFFNSLLFES